jgi:hypothetical protein
MLATAGLNGAPQALLSAHGFDASLIAGLVDRGLATLTAEKVRAGGKLIEVGKVRITEAGREALAADRWFFRDSYDVVHNHRDAART